MINVEVLQEIVGDSNMAWPHVISELDNPSGPHNAFDVTIYPTYLLFSDGQLVKRTGDLDLIIEGL